MDLQDLMKKKAPLTKPQYRLRVRGVLQSNKSRQVARNCVRHFRKQCKAVIKEGGKAVRG